jgi:hypothetical protein
MDLQGNIERFTLPEIFQLLCIGKKTGTLGVQYNKETTLVYFRDGDVIFANSTARHTRLGDMLVERGRITPEHLDEALTAQRVEGETRRLGALLIDRKAITRSELNDELRKQVEEIVYELLAWKEGSFKFYESQYPTDEEITISISTENIILEGMRRIDEMARLGEKLPPFNTVMCIAKAADGRRRDVALDPDEWNVFSLVDGHRTVGEIIEECDSDDVSAARHLAGLYVAGLVEPYDGMPEEKTGRLEELAGRLDAMLDEYLGKS